MKKQLVLLRTNPRSFAKIIKNRIGTNGKSAGSLTPFSKTKQFYLLIDFLLKVFFLSNLIRIFVALYGTIAL